jgi:CheY-like chemotaxis protein
VAKILIADDNSNIQKMVVLALKDQGIDVVAVGNGEAAVRKIADIKPDLVLADVFMPVRNGYEVCKFVKDDSSLAHIPVILLVGAFDPLDEQEAQRVGADGVLKKPFVPPDPLISMVKSALARAGVSLGTSAPARTPPPPMPAAPAKVVPPPVAEIEAAPVPEENFVTASGSGSRPAPFSIDQGSKTLAFGSLLDSPAPEDDAVFALSPATAAATPDRDWGSAEESEEVEEEAAESGAWHASSVPEELEDLPAGQKDWREVAFAGIGAEKTRTAEWAPSTEKNSLTISEAEAAELAQKQKSAPAVINSNGKQDWTKEIAAVLPDRSKTVTEIPAAVLQEIPFALPAVPATPAYEAAPPPPAPVSEAPVFVAPIAPPAPPVPAPSVIEEPEDVAAVEVEASPALSFGVPATKSPWETQILPSSQLASTWDAATPSAATTIEEHAAPADVPESTEQVAELEPEIEAEPELPGVSAYAAESLLTPAALEDVQKEVAQVASEAPLAELERSHSPATPTTENAAAPALSTDELVAKVLAKMNPDVLQAVTREILKPLIQAMVRDELDKK